MIKLFGIDVQPIYEDERIGDIKHASVDIHKIHDALGFNPGTPLEEGLCSLLSQFTKQRIMV